MTTPKERIGANHHHPEYATKRHKHQAGDVDGVAPEVHNHDDLYFTETEVTDALAGKADTVHFHDDRYYTESSVNEMVFGGGARTVRPYAKLSKNALQSTTTGTEVTISWQVANEESDASMGDTANNRIVAPAAGLYLISGGAQVGAGGSGVRRLVLKVSGAGVVGEMGPGSSAFDTLLSCSTFTRLAAGDAVTAAFLTTGDSPDIFNGNSTFLAAMWLAP